MSYINAYGHPSMIPTGDFQDGLMIGPEHGMHTIRKDPLNFEVSIDVRHFYPDELSVRRVDDQIIIHGKWAAQTLR